MHLTPEGVARMKERRLVCWRGLCWVTPERARELEVRRARTIREQLEQRAGAGAIPPTWPRL